MPVHYNPAHHLTYARPRSPNRMIHDAEQANLRWAARRGMKE
ncbi:MAG: hypothetical protein R2873_25585 [Caldilineaceae bacterium]